MLLLPEANRRSRKHLIDQKDTNPKLSTNAPWEESQVNLTTDDTEGHLHFPTH